MSGPIRGCLALLAIGVLSASGASGQSEGATVTVTPSFVSQYMYRGQRLGGPSFQTSVEADGRDLGVGVWASQPAFDKVANQSDPEIDPYGYWRLPISGNFAVIPGFEIYTYPDADGGKTGPGFFRTRGELNTALECRFLGITLLPKAYYDFRLRGADFELSGFYGLPLGFVGGEVDFKATAGMFNYGNALNGATPGAGESGGYALIGATVPFQITRSSKLSVGWAYTAGFDDRLRADNLPMAYDRLASWRNVVSVSFAWTF